MILRILKSNHTVNYLLFPIFGILFWIKNLLFPNPSAFHSHKIESPVFGLIVKLTNDNLILNSLLALFLVLFMALLIQQINTRYNFIRMRTVLPAPLFIIIIGGLTSLHTLHPVYFGAVFLLIAIYRSFSAFDQAKPYSAAFDTGFLIGLGSIFYFNLIIIFPAFFIGISILSRNYTWRPFVLAIMGFILPFLFVAAYAFFTDQLIVFFNNIIQSFSTNSGQFRFSIAQIVFIGYLITLTIFGSIKIIQQFDTKKVSTRKYFLVFFIIFILSVSGYLLVPAISREMLIIMCIPLTLLITNFFVFLKSRLLGEILFAVLLLIVITLQFLP